MAETKLATFLNSPLMAWVRTYEDRYVCDTVEALADGVVLNHIMHQIYPDSSSTLVNTEVNGDASLRAQNLTVLMQSIRLFFENYLQQLIVMQLPDIMAIAYEPETDFSLDQLEKILLLLLGCAVQCEAKEKLIENIKKMNKSLQGSLVYLIQEITHNPDNVYGMDFENISSLTKKDLETECQNVYIRLKRVTRERDNYYASFSEASQERNHIRKELMTSTGRPPSSPLSTLPSRSSFTGDAVSINLVACQAEVQELRAKLRDLTEQMDLKSLSMSESRKENIMLQEKINKLQQEKQRMLEEVQWSRDHHDELDALRMKARRIDQLETENSKFRRKQEDMEHVQKLVKEVKNEKQLLAEGNKSLEAEVERLNSRFSSLDDVEMENAQLRQQVRALTEEKESDMEKLQALMEHNAKLELNSKQDAEQLGDLRQELDTMRFSTPGVATPSLANADFNFPQQTPERPVAEALQTRLTALERDNRELERVTSDLRDARARVTTLEDQNKTMQSQRFVEQKELAIAREELKREREKVKQGEEDKKKSKEDLQRAFAQREHELQAQVIEEKRNYLGLEQRLDDVAQRRAELAQDRITSLEARLESSEKEKLQLRNELTSMSEEVANISVKLVTANQELRSKVDKLAASHDELGILSERLRFANDELEEQRRNVRNLEQQHASEVKRSEGLNLLLKEERSRSDQLEKVQLDLQKRAETLELHFSEEKKRAMTLLQDQEDWKQRASSLEQHFEEERSRAESLLQTQAAQLQAAITEASQQNSKKPESPTHANTQTQTETQEVERCEVAVQTEVELWLEQVVALAQAHGFLGGPVEGDGEGEVPASSEAQEQEGDATENSNKPTQAVAPVKATQVVTPVSPSYVMAEVARSASSVKSSKVITPRAAASMLLSSSPALNRAVSSLIASPGNSPLLSRSVISSVAGSGESRGSDIMPAVVSVVESIRGVMETVGTPTSAHKTEASSTRQQDADAVKRTINFTEGDPESLENSEDHAHTQGTAPAERHGVADTEYDPEGLRAELRRLKQEYSALDIQLNTIKRQYQGEQADLESEIRNLRRQLHASKMQISELNDEVGRVRKQLRTAHQQNSSMEEELTHNRHQLQSTRQQWQDARQQLHAAGAQLQVAQMTNQQLETHNTQIEDNNVALSNRCDALETMSNSLSEEIRNLYTEVKKLLLENRELRMRNDEAKDKFIDEGRQYTDRLSELESERIRLNEQLDTIKKTKKKKPSAFSKVANLGKKARHLLAGEKERQSAAGQTRTDGYDSSSSGGGVGNVPHSMSMPRIVARDRADTLPVNMSSMMGSGSMESFGGSVVQLAGVRKARSIAGSLNDNVSGTHSHEDDEAASQLVELMSGLARMDSPGPRASLGTASPGIRPRTGGEIVSLEDFLRETDKTPLSRKKMFNEVLVDTPPEMRRLSAASNQNAAGGIHPRRELSAIDAPAFLESLKSTPARPQQQQQDQFQRQKPVHTGRGLLRPASSDSRTSSSQNSNEQGLERSGSAGAMTLPTVPQTAVRRLNTNSSASSLESHSTTASPLTMSTGIPLSASAGNVHAIAARSNTPPVPRDRDSTGTHQPLSRKRAMVDGTSIGSGRMNDSISSAPIRTSTPSSGGGSSSRFGDEDSDVMNVFDALRIGGGGGDASGTVPSDMSYGSADATISGQPPVIRDLAHSPTRPSSSPAVQPRNPGRLSPRPPDGGKGDENETNADWFEYGTV